METLNKCFPTLSSTLKEEAIILTYDKKSFINRIHGNEVKLLLDKKCQKVSQIPNFWFNCQLHES